MSIDLVNLVGQTLSPNVELFTVDFTTAFTYDASGPSVIQLCNERSDIVYDSDTYSSVSIKFKPPEYSLDSSKDPSASFEIFAQDDDMLDAFFSYESLFGVTVIRIIVQEQHLDGGSNPDLTQKIDEVWFMDELKSRDRNSIEFTLTPSLGLDKFRQPALAPITRRTFDV